MKYGIFGGTFDPFTIAHKAIVNEVLKQDLVDDLIILPTIVQYHRPGKNQWLTDKEKLYCIGRMTEDLSYKYMRDNPNGYTYSRIHVSSRELDLKKSLSESEIQSRRSFHIIQDIKDYYGNDNEYYFILGTDSLKNFKTWYKWEDLLTMIKVIAVQGRDNEFVKTDIDYVPVLIDEKYSNTSASEIRSHYNNVDDYLNSVLTTL